MDAEKDYVLGTHDAELARLGVQNALWRPRATDAWQRAHFAPGQTIVDLGAGPGWAALDLAELVGPRGRVLAVDRSHRFLDALEAMARARGLTQVTALERDLDDADDLPFRGVDGIWSRWVYSFVRDPRALLARALRALRPGGALVLHEYVDYGAWRLAPARPEFERFVREVMASWREAGGEPDVGRELPGWLEDLGAEVRSLRLLGEAARPGEPMWEWPSVFVDVGLARLVELGRIAPAEAADIAAGYAEAARAPGAFQVTPTVLEIVAFRPR